MTNTTETKNLAAALAKAQGTIRPAELDRVNPHFKNKYATLASIFDACRGPLAANGIAIVQGVEAEGAQVKVTTTLLHVSGESISSTLTLTAAQNNVQGIGSTITYGRRYGLSAMVGIVADDDDDANVASEKPKPAPRQQAQRPAPMADQAIDLPDMGPSDRGPGILRPKADLDALMARLDASTGDRAKSLVALKAAVQQKWPNAVPHKTDWTQADADELFRLATDVPF